MNDPLRSYPHDCTIFIPSCDPYADLWPPFFQQLWRYWPDCPFEIVLGANTLEYPDQRVRTLRSSHGTTWTDRVREQLESLQSTYVLLWLEDFLLRAPVPTARVVEALAFAQERDATVVRLVPRPPADIPDGAAPSFGAIRPGAPYRVSTQAAIWNRRRLLELMRTGESIWAFELEGSRRSDSDTDRYFGVFATLLPYGHHVVERGKWFPHAVRWARRERVTLDLSRRPVMSTPEYAWWLSRKSFSLALGKLPWSFRQRLRRMLGRRH